MGCRVKGVCRVLGKVFRGDSVLWIVGMYFCFVLKAKFKKWKYVKKRKAVIKYRSNLVRIGMAWRDAYIRTARFVTYIRTRNYFKIKKFYVNVKLVFLSAIFT